MVVLHLRAAVQLRLDPLRVRVGRQLLAGTVRDQVEGVVLLVGHAELERAHLAHLLGGGVRAHLQRLGGAAAARLLQRHPQVVLPQDTGVRFKTLHTADSHLEHKTKGTTSMLHVL